MYSALVDNITYFKLHFDVVHLNVSVYLFPIDCLITATLTIAWSIVYIY